MNAYFFLDFVPGAGNGKVNQRYKIRAFIEFILKYKVNGVKYIKLIGYMVIKSMKKIKVRRTRNMEGDILKRILGKSH